MEGTSHASLDEVVSLREGLEEAGKFGNAEYRVGGAGHLLWLDPRLWEEEVRGKTHPLLSKTLGVKAGGPCQC